MPLDPQSITQGYDPHLDFWAEATLPDGRRVGAYHQPTPQDALEHCSSRPIR